MNWSYCCLICKERFYESISICPQDAESDGYVMIWAEDAIETIKEK